MTQVITDGRISRLASYIEPDLYALVQQEANAAGDTISNWLRRLILAELDKAGKISPELMRKLASGGR